MSQLDATIKISDTSSIDISFDANNKYFNISAPGRLFYPNSKYTCGSITKLLCSDISNIILHFKKIKNRYDVEILKHEYKKLTQRNKALQKFNSRQFKAGRFSYRFIDNTVIIIDKLYKSSSDSKFKTHVVNINSIIKSLENINKLLVLL